MNLETITYPCALTYRFTTGGVVRLAVAYVNHAGMVEVTTQLLAQLYGQPTPAGPEGGATEALDWRTLHQLMAAHGGELTEAGPW